MVPAVRALSLDSSIARRFALDSMYQLPLSHSRDTNERTPPTSIDAGPATMHLASTQPQQVQPQCFPSSVGRIKMAALEQDAQWRVPVPHAGQAANLLTRSGGVQVNQPMLSGSGDGGSHRWGLESVDFRPVDAAAIASQAPQ